MLHIQGLKHAYDGGLTTIAYPDWQVAKGDHSLILGGSGCGKTTLLHLIGGLMRPSAGCITIDGEDFSGMSGGVLDKFRGANIGIVFQNPHLVKSLTVKENLMLAQYFGKHRLDIDRIFEVLGHLSIRNLANRKVHQISQGQAQRVSIGRGVINAPKLLLADEPTASLDDANCHRVIELLRAQAEDTGATLIVATHDHRVKSAFKNQLTL